ncbi:hypothetical protein LguiB_028860 [Lonicera macranthoides]
MQITIFIINGFVLASSLISRKHGQELDAVLLRFGPLHSGVLKFLEFVIQNTNELTGLYKYFCTKCCNHKRRLNVNEMYKYLIGNGIME